MAGTFDYIEGFKITNKICDMLENEGCPTEVSANLGADIFFTVVKDLGLEFSNKPTTFEEFNEMVTDLFDTDMED